MYPFCFIFPTNFSDEQLSTIRNVKNDLTEFITPLATSDYSSKLLLHHKLITITLSLRDITVDPMHNAARHNSYELLISIVKLDLITEHLDNSKSDSLKELSNLIKVNRHLLMKIGEECLLSAQASHK